MEKNQEVENNAEKNMGAVESIGRYFDLLNSAIKKRNSNPNKLNVEMCNKYYKLYADEHIKTFGCEPDITKIKGFKIEDLANNSNNNINSNNTGNN